MQFVNEAPYLILKRPVQEFMITKKALSKIIASEFPGCEEMSSRAGQIRLRLQSFPAQEKLQELLEDKFGSGCTAEQFLLNRAFSSKYLSSKIELPSGETFGLVIVTGSRGAAQGTCGVGESELISIVNSLGGCGSESKSFSLVIGDEVFKGVQRAIKPCKGKFGEPKIDVLLLDKQESALVNGALSLKGRMGTPSYEGWARYLQAFHGQPIDLRRSQLVDMVDLYRRFVLDDRISWKTGEEIFNFGGDFALDGLSEEIKDFALYGNELTSGGEPWGKRKVDRLVLIDELIAEPLAVEPLGDRTFRLRGAEVCRGIMKGTPWEPCWLFRKASDRWSPRGVGKSIKGCRLMITTSKRASSARRKLL